jgi:phospholipid transport system substrate-binding protein
VVSGKDRISIPSFILSKEGKTEMVYKFYKAKNGSWLIYDVEIAGVSIVQTFRAQFAEILKTHDVFGLIEKLHGTEKL